MTSSPLPPPWAARVWLEGSTLQVDLPMGDGLPSHRLAIPWDNYGMARLKVLLNRRDVHSVLNTKGDPTQHRVDADIALLKRKIDPDKVRVMKPKDRFAPNLRAAARTVLRSAGLIGATRR